MRFQIVEVDDETKERRVVRIPYQTRDEAVAAVVSASKTLEYYGYNEQQDYWWGRDKCGKLTRFYVEAYN